MIVWLGVGWGVSAQHKETYVGIRKVESHWTGGISLCGTLAHLPLSAAEHRQLLYFPDLKAPPGLSQNPDRYSASVSPTWQGLSCFLSTTLPPFAAFIFSVVYLARFS